MALYVGKVRFEDGQEKFVMTDGTSGYVYPALFDSAAEVAVLTRSGAITKSEALESLKLAGSEAVEVWTDVDLNRGEPCFSSTASNDRRVLTGFLCKDDWADAWKRASDADNASPYDGLNAN